MIDFPLLMVIFVGLMVLRASLLPWGSSAVLHDPLSALAATVADALATVGPAAATAGTTAATDAAITLPEVAVTAAAPAAAEAATAGTLADVALPLATTGTLAGLAGAGGASSLPLASVAAPATSGTLGAGLPASVAAPTIPTGGAGGSTISAVSPAAPAPPPSITSADALASGVPNQIGQVADAGATDAVSGPVAGNTAAGSDSGILSGTEGGQAAAKEPSLLSKIGLGGVEDFVGANKGLITLGSAALPLAVLAFQNSNMPGLDAAQRLANQTGATSGALQAASLNGVLPPGYEDALLRAQTAGTAGIRSNYANLGLSGSSTEAQDVSAGNQSIEAQRAQLLSQLTSQGIQAAGVAGNLDTAIANTQLAQDEELQQALSTLATNLTLASLPARIS